MLWISKVQLRLKRSPDTIFILRTTCLAMKSQLSLGTIYQFYLANVKVIISLCRLSGSFQSVELTKTFRC